MLDATLTFQLVFCQSDGSGQGPNSLVRMNPNWVPFAVAGRDWHVCASNPLARIVQAFNTQMNNAAVQSQNVCVPDLTHMLEGPKGRAGHSTTQRNGTTASWDDADGTQVGMSAGYGEMQEDGDVGPGAFNVRYCDDTGALLTYDENIRWFPNPSAPPTPRSTFYRYGCPITSPLGAGQLHLVVVQIRLIDPMFCSPWASNYARSFEETGLFGLSSIVIQAQLANASSQRIIQGCTNSGCILMPGSYNKFSSRNPFATNGGGTASSPFFSPGGIWPSPLNAGQSGDLLNSGGCSAVRIWMTYFSPTIQSTLPSRSIVPYMVQQYFQNSLIAIADGGVGSSDGNMTDPQTLQQYTFPAVTFSNVPDLIAISFRPDKSQQRVSETDYSGTLPDNAISQMTFANQSGLLSGAPSVYVTQLSRNNGVRDPIGTCGGADGSGQLMIKCRPTICGGSVMLLRPGIDFPLPTGVSVGSTGQVQFAFTINFNAPAQQQGKQWFCTVTAISSGFFVTDNGVSRQLLVGLDEATVLNAPKDVDRFVTQKLVGGHGLNLSASHGRGLLDDLKQKVRESGQQAVQKARDLAGHVARKGRTIADSLQGGTRSGGPGQMDCSDGSIPVAGSKRTRTLAERLADP